MDGPYRTERELGQGGMATVHLAEIEFAAAVGFVLSFAVSPDGKWLALAARGEQIERQQRPGTFGRSS